MKKVLAATVAVLMVGSMSAKADIVQYRFNDNALPGSRPGHDIIVEKDNVEVILLDATSGHPTVEFGRLWQASRGKNHILLAGGYLSYWSPTEEWYAEPYVLGRAWKGKTVATAKLFAYVPLEKGAKTYVGASELSLVRNLTPSFGVGAEAVFFKENPGQLAFQWGPTVRVSHGKTSASIRYLPYGKGGDARAIRATITRSF